MTLSKNQNLLSTICNVYFAFPEEISSYVDGADPYHVVITFKTGKAWKEIYFTPGSAEVTENLKAAEQGVLHDQLLKFIFPGEDDGNLRDLELMKDRPVILKMYFPSANKSKIMGTMENGARLIFNFSTSQKSTGWEMAFSCLADEPACWLQ